MSGFRGLQCFLMRLFLLSSISFRLQSSSQQLFGISSHAELESLHLQVISAPVLCSNPWRGRTEMLQLRRSFREIGPWTRVPVCMYPEAGSKRSLMVSPGQRRRLLSLSELVLVTPQVLTVTSLKLFGGMAFWLA